MKNEKMLIIFEGKTIRRVFDEKKGKWYFSIIDIIAVLTNQIDFKKAQSYWTTLKQRLKEEGSQSVTNCDKLKFMAKDSKYYTSDAADVETILRLIQSVPSKNAEPFKLWLAKVGNERLQEIADPERSLNRSREYWRRLGRSEKWIQQRLIGQEVRNKLTDYWKGHEVVKPDEFALLSNIIHKEWTDLSINEHKDLKNLKQENLRDHMNDAELVFTALAELSTRQIAESVNATGLEENKIPAKKGGHLAKKARLSLESETKKPVVNDQNFLGKSPNKKIK
jgi:hypothetical protein